MRIAFPDVRCWMAALVVIVAAGMQLASEDTKQATQPWAFRSLRRPAIPAVKDSSRIRTPIDRFIQATLETHGLSLGPSADKETLIRRVAFDLTGLPPTPSEVAEFATDSEPDAYERVVDRFLASPNYGERWGKYWLDVAGYADSNGYFNADSDRPLAHRYRDYVIRSLNSDKPFDQFVREQIAGDELSGFDPQTHERTATPRMIELLEATHFLRNGPDGSGESDGNPEEVKIDRYSALEASQQIVVSSLLALTIQCAKCHDHKFEPITQREYYQFQAHLYPAFNWEKWIKPNDRFAQASLPGEVEAWETQQRGLDERLAAKRKEFSHWVREHRPPAGFLFQDDFDDPKRSLAENWSNAAPGDMTPGGVAAVQLVETPNVPVASLPAAMQKDGTLQIIEGGPSGDKLLSTKRSFDWTPNQPGEWIQVTFDLLADKVRPDEMSAARIAFFIATHDFNDTQSATSGAKSGGNILFDGNPSGGAAVHVDYPGADEKQRGAVGTSGYKPGQNFGVRITNVDGKKYRVEQLVDWLTEDKSLDLAAEELPDGGFGFEFCCGRSFVVDNVVIESSSGGATDAESQALVKRFRADYDSHRKALAEETQSLQKQQMPRPGRIAWLTDVAAEPPDVPILQRGNVTTPGELVPPATFRTLTDEVSYSSESRSQRTTNRRSDLANWLTQRDSRAAALMSRVQVNRVWQRHFGRGLTATPDNLGESGAVPIHPELLEWLAAEFGSATENPAWSLKHLHRLILNSAVYRQTSAFDERAFAVDPGNQWWWRQTVRRLDAESIRDGMLSVSGELDRRMFGPYAPTQRNSAAEVVVSESQLGARRRSIYLQQRRTQTLSMLSLFDAPSVTFNCVQRPVTTMPLQSLSLLNSDFAAARARQFAQRLDREASADPRRRIRRAFELATGSVASNDDLREALHFVEEQTRAYEPTTDAASRAWIDFCQMLLATNACLYVE